MSFHLQTGAVRLSTLLYHHFPKRKHDVAALINLCHLMQSTKQLTSSGIRQLCDEMVRTPELLDDFLQASDIGEQKAEEWILSRLSPRPGLSWWNANPFTAIHNLVARLVS